MDLTGTKIIYNNKQELFSAIYNFLRIPTLANPEITFFIVSSPEPIIRAYSRDGGFGEGRIPDREKWESMAGAEDVYGFLCIAGTDAGDTRRVSIAYIADGKSSIFVNFPGEGRKLTGNEKKILSDLQNRLG